MNDDLEALRARVARHQKAARGRPLVELAGELTKRYWDAGIGSPGARPLADEAIEALGEAHGYFEPDSLIRAQLAAQLGILLSLRHVGHGSAEADRERGIVMLEEGLAFPQLPPVMVMIARLMLGQLLLYRSMHSGNFTMLMRNDPAGTEASDADRAVGLLEQVVDGPVLSAQITEVAQTTLAMAKTVRDLVGVARGGPAGLMSNLSRIPDLLASLQKMQQDAAARPQGVGFGRIPNPFDLQADALVGSDRRTWPVVVVEAASSTTPTPVPRAAVAPRPRMSADTLREAFLTALPLTAALALLEQRSGPPDDETVDELVALASSLVVAPGSDAADQLLLAVALHLRGLLDDDPGWGEADLDDVGGDARAAEDSLLAAADALLGEPADVVAVAVRLAMALDARHPDRNLHARLDERFGPVTAALRAVGADGLLYPTSGEPLLLVAGTGRSAVVGSVELPERIVVAGIDPVPDVPIVSFVRSGAQLVELSRRSRRELGAAAVFVAGPRGDREHAEMDAMLLRRTFFPRSVGLGRAVEHVAGPGTPDEVRARLDASLLHLGCGVNPGGGLELASSGVLAPQEIAAGPPAATGGLAVLPPTASGATELTDALLESRFTGVISFREPVPARVAGLVYFLLYTFLVDQGCDAATAVAAVHRWLADPQRKPLEHAPAWLQDAAESDLDDPACRNALIYHGV